MVQFSIQPDSEIPASTQLADQLSFAITSRQYEPGHQLPSTRQLATWTGLHRNTINKVYQQLKQTGLVEARGGSGIYVSLPKNDDDTESPIQTVRQSIDKLLSLGCSMTQAKELFLSEVEWRLNCNAQILVASGREDPGAATIMANELERELAVPIQSVAIEDLPQVLEHTSAGTVVTNRFWLEQTRKAVGNNNIRVIAVDIYNYVAEIKRIKELPIGSYVGIVSISLGILRLADSLISSFRGDDLVIVQVLPQDIYRLQTIARDADVIVCGHSGRDELKAAIASTKSDRIRPVEVMHCERFISIESLEQLKLEIGSSI